MKEKFSIYPFLSAYKYVITIILGILIVGIVDENSLYKRMMLQYEIHDLKEEIEQYTSTYEADKQQLRDLARNPKNISRIARERYFMKADDEDIFVLSTDAREEVVKPEEKNDDETAK